MSPSRLALLVVAVLVCAVALVPEDEPRSAPAPTGVAAAPVDLPAVRVVRGWDERRATAYADGAPDLLRDLYVDGSGAGASDVRVLRSYLARGWRVTGMRMQVLAFRVLERRARRLRVEVTDRLVGAAAVGGGRRVVLPRDGASTRRITLVRGADDVWRVAAVGPVS